MPSQNGLRPLGIAGTLVTGLVALLCAFFAFANQENSVGGGVCLIAAAIAFTALMRFE